MFSNSKLCERLTRMTKETQNQKLRLFAKVDITTKLKILYAQKQLFYKLNSIHGEVDNSVLTLCSLILAINDVEKSLSTINLNVLKFRSKNIKSNVKREKILALWSIVRSLKIEQKMSFRDISKYFLKYHRLNVSYSTIYEMWNEIENNNKKG